MPKAMNPPKKHRYPLEKPKAPTFYEKHAGKIKVAAIITAIVVALALVAVFVRFTFFPVTPYDMINIGRRAEIPAYKGLEISEKTITDAIASEKKALLRRYAMYEEVKSGVIEEGNNVTVSTKGYYVENGERGKEVTAGGSLTDYEITDIGSHKTENGADFSPEIQKALIGTDFVATPTVTATIEYPEDYGVAEFNGKTIEYDVTVSKVTKTLYPDYTDDFVKQKTGLESIAAYEAQIRMELEQNLLWNVFAEKAKINSYPKSKIQVYSDEFEQYYRSYMDTYGLSFSQLLKDVLDTDEEGYYAQRREYAEGTVKEEMLLYYIVKSERIMISRSEYKSKCIEYAEANGYSSVSELLSEHSEESIRRTIYWEKVKILLHENCVKAD